MLCLASRALDYELNDEGRLRLLEKLQSKGFTPLIRSTRLSCYEHAMSSPHHVAEMEQVIATYIDSEGQVPYVQGDIFCFEDHTFFLLFGGTEQNPAGVRVGIIYEPQTSEPLRKLDSFCQTISRCLAKAGAAFDEDREDGEGLMRAWRQDRPVIHSGFMRFVAGQDVDTLSTVIRKENALERVRASEFLDDAYTRLFLRRLKEAYAEGYSVNPLTEGTAAPSEYTVNKLLAVGLLQREVVVSCRQTGHTLFSLPSPDALAVITISNAKCSECGAWIADEKVEEVIAPTQLSAALLEDGAWLVNRLYSILRSCGIPESDIAVEPPAGDGEARIMTRVCGEPFLIVMRDGDLTPAFARRAINKRIETEASHLVVVVTGTVHNEGRMSLVGFAKRLVRGGNDFELIIAEGASAAAAELQYAFEQVSQRALAEQLWELDASLGLSVVRLITARFQILRNSKGSARPGGLPAPKDSVSVRSHASHAQNGDRVIL